MKLIIKESQVKNLIDTLINEQDVNIARGGTDLRTVSHKYLETNHGLPQGSKYENYYYIADIKSIIGQSAKGNISNFLSVFRPYKSSDKYIDYVDINGDVLTQDDMKQKVSKRFNFVEGNVIASHNGLLGIARAMESLQGKPGILTLQFGQYKTGAEAKDERLTQGVIFQSNTAFDRTSGISGLLSVIVMSAIKPEYRAYTASQSQTKNSTDDNTFLSYIENYINNIIIGSNGFFNPNNVSIDKIVSTLTPKGLITKSDVDIKPLFNALKNLRNLDDKTAAFSGVEYKNRTDYNTVKYEQIKNISNQYIPSLISDIKEKYTKNLKIFINHYLPEMQNTLLYGVDNRIIMPIYNLADMHRKEVTGKSRGGGQTTGTLQTIDRRYD